ncbi:MAG TPA: glucosyl-3-phosphoglycerate synthase [Acidimicrobiales bacterium]
MIRSYDHYDYDAATLVERKGGQRISVCLPARDEEATVADIVTAVREQLVERVPLVDELLVIDDHSTDATAERASAAGACVIDAAEVLRDIATGPGKGSALWRSLHISTGDIVVWCDTDVTNFSPQFVVGLIGPLLDEPDLVYVKGFYRRPLGTTSDGGGRVTELVARPLLALLHPSLTSIVQPLSGEYAGRRHALEQVPFVAGYGVEMGLLIDLAARFGTDAMAQVDLGTRRHRNRPLVELGPQATTIMQVAMRRASPDFVPEKVLLERPDAPPVTVSAEELPPLLSVREYLLRHHSADAP